MKKELNFPKDKQPRRMQGNSKLAVCEGMHWKVHLPNLLKEISQSLKGSSALKIPILTLARILMLVSKRALELDDPKLNSLMLDLALYEIDEDGK